MRKLFTTAESGLTRHALEWGDATGQWPRVQRGIYADGPEDPTPLVEGLKAEMVVTEPPLRHSACWNPHRSSMMSLPARIDEDEAPGHEVSVARIMARVSWWQPRSELEC